MNGIINIYKEAGFTSFDVVAKLRGMLHQKKIGHTGTLDPDAEGVLPVCLGKATKVCDLLTDKDKEYCAVLLLGQKTDTQDTSGTVLAKATPEQISSLDENVVQKTILDFQGEIEQIPPMYSALKVNGKKLCDLARQGVTVERKSRKVTIHEIEILSMELPYVTLRVHCSKGTYIRTLCEDIGERLGCFGCMAKLTRTRVADFLVSDSIRLSDLQNELNQKGTIEAHLHSVDELFSQYSSCIVDSSAQKLLANGNRIPRSFVQQGDSTTVLQDKDIVRLYDKKGCFIGLYSYQKQQEDYKPLKIFVDNNDIF